jgi:hypothetical protein
MNKRKWTDTTAKDVVTISGNIWNNDTRTVANAVNYNAQILKDALNRIEELEKNLKPQAESEKKMTKEEALDWLISRKEHYEMDDNCQELAEAIGIGIDAVKREMDKDQEITIGHWIWDTKSKVYRCSCCNYFPWRVHASYPDEIFEDLTRTNAYKYCPSCGAKMTESEDKE